MRCCGSRPTSQPARPFVRRQIASTQGCSLQDDATCEARQRAGSSISSSSDDTDFSDKEYERLQCASAWRDTIFRMELEIVAQREQHESIVEQRLEHITVQERQLTKAEMELAALQKSISVLRAQLANVDGEGMHTKDIFHPAKCSAEDALVSSTCADDSMLKFEQQQEAGQHRQDFSRGANVSLRGNLFERGLALLPFLRNATEPATTQQCSTPAALAIERLAAVAAAPRRRSTGSGARACQEEESVLPPAPIDGNTGMRTSTPTPGSSRWLKAQAREAVWASARANAEARQQAQSRLRREANDIGI